MAEIIWGTDFRKKAKKFDTPEMVKLAKEVMGLVESANDRTIYESSLGYLAPESDPA